MKGMLEIVHGGNGVTRLLRMDVTKAVFKI